MTRNIVNYLVGIIPSMAGAILFWGHCYISHPQVETGSRGRL